MHCREYGYFFYVREPLMERILVVEDDLALSTGLCFELDAAGYATQAAYNVRKA